MDCLSHMLDFANIWVRACVGKVDCSKCASGCLVLCSLLLLDYFLRFFALKRHSLSVEILFLWKQLGEDFSSAGNKCDFVSHNTTTQKKTGTNVSRGSQLLWSQLIKQLEAKYVITWISMGKSKQYLLFCRNLPKDLSGFKRDLHCRSRPADSSCLWTWKN